MSEFVLDTSVAIAWYLPEAFSSRAREWRERLLSGADRFLAPTLHFWETANVLRTYVRRGEIPEALAREIYELHLEAPIQLAEPRRERVLEVALEYDATAYDAVYIALSLSKDIPFLTAERTTTPWVVRLGERIVSVRT
ncbi:MAG: type II toxin-antitoxin system VapC family toxin [Planctomycetes bacterium]|nr:type II toxin-antitoxin system VapC family toxin [Planctomycetota bacterium]